MNSSLLYDRMTIQRLEWTIAIDTYDANYSFLIECRM